MTDSPSEPAVPPVSTATRSSEELKAIATAQKLLIGAVVASVAIIPLSLLTLGAASDPGGWRFAGGLFWVVYVGRAFFCGYLASKIGRSPFGWGLGAVIPNFIGLIVLLVLNGKATGVLTASGWRVGLFGAESPSAPEPEGNTVGSTVGLIVALVLAVVIFGLFAMLLPRVN